MCAHFIKAREHMLLSSTGRIYESNPVTVINDHCLAKWEETIYAMTDKAVNQRFLAKLSKPKLL
jgi:hypothetical protein